MNTLDQIEIDSADALWDWLDAHHSQDASYWLVTYKKQIADKYVSREQVLDALVAYGWIDGRRKALDDTRTMQLISKRKVQHWAASYKERAEKLEAEGRMRAAGRKSVEDGKASGLWDFMADVDALIVPEDLRLVLDAAPKAAEYFDTCPPAYKRNLLRWVKLAKTDATRAKRLAAIVAACLKGERIAQM